MNNLLRCVPLWTIMLGLLFCQRDESPEHASGVEVQIIVQETTAPRLDKVVQFGAKQKRMGRLSQSADEDRNP